MSKTSYTKDKICINIFWKFQSVDPSPLTSCLKYTIKVMNIFLYDLICENIVFVVVYDKFIY